MKQRIESKLHNVHNELTAKMNFNAKAAVDRVRAAKMQQVLYQIKNLSTTASNPIEGLLNEQAMTIIDESLGMLNANRKGKRRLSGHDLFHRAHGTSTSMGGDDIFEEELAAVLSSIEKQATGTTIGVEGRLVGGQSANILMSEVSKDVEKVMNKFINNTERRINNTTDQNKHWTKPVARSGKVDVEGLTKMDITAELNPAWTDLYHLFSGCTFSVKNYSSFFTKSLNIHLGNTDVYKALYGSLSALSYDNDEINSIISAGLHSYENSGNQTVANHFYHLRFIYELTGVGLYDSEGEPISGVDFLIYNDPNTDAIYVRSTADMIATELEKDAPGSMFSGISIKKSDF